MTNTKFRKRALLSSVAMLLVALIALGSATFAWFAANPNASTQGLQLKTTAAAGLVMKTETDSTWDHETYFGVASWSGNSGAATGHGGSSNDPTFKNFNLQPASQNQSTPATFYTVEAVDADTVEGYKAESAQGAGDGVDNTVSSIDNLDMFVYKEKFSFRLSDGAAAMDGSTAAKTATIKLTGVTITPVQNARMTSAVRVAIVDANNHLVATYGINKPTNQAFSTTGNYSTATTTKTAITNAAAQSTNITTNNTVFTGALSSAEDQTGKECTVYVYLDGEDASCYSNNVGTISANQMISNIELSFTLA